MGGGDGKRNLDGRLNHGGRWREEQEWPLARTVSLRYYLRAGGSLSTESPEEGTPPALYTYDPRHPVPTISATGGVAELLPFPTGFDPEMDDPRTYMHNIFPDGGAHQKEKPGLLGARPPYPLLADRPDVLVFQTEPLLEDLEVTGGTDVNLWISSSAVDTDFTAMLLDIYPPSEDYPEGYHLNIADSIIRARYRNGFDREEMMDSGHVYRVRIALPPTSNLFKAGHRIRLDVASTGTAAAIHGAHAAPYHVAQPPSDQPVRPIRSGSTPSSDARTRAALSASSTITPICCRPYGARSLFSVAQSSTLALRVTEPFTVIDSVAKPRRANSRPYPCSEPVDGSSRNSRFETNSALLAVPGTHTIPGRFSPAS